MLIRVCPSFTAVFGDAADVTAHSCVVGGRSSPGVGGGLTGNGDGAWSASWSFAHTVPPPFMSTSVQDGEMTGCRDPVWRPQRSSDRKAEPRFSFSPSYSIFGPNSEEQLRSPALLPRRQRPTLDGRFLATPPH
jgi:hypothetical protein